MNSARWQKVKGLFDVALEIPAAKREEFLDNACGGDRELCREVEKLLASFENAESFMEQPAAREVASVIIKAETKHLEAGKCFGHYEINYTRRIKIVCSQKLCSDIQFRYDLQQFGREGRSLETSRKFFSGT